MASRSPYSQSPPRRRRQPSYSDEDDLPTQSGVPFRLVNPPRDYHPRDPESRSPTPSTSASSASDDHIDPDDSASGPPPIAHPRSERGSHVSRRAPQVAAEHLSRAGSRGHAPEPPRQASHHPREREIERDYEHTRVRRVTQEQPPYPDERPMQRHYVPAESYSSGSASDTTSYDSRAGHRHEGGYHPGYAPAPRPVRRPSHDYYGGGAMVPMRPPPRDPYYDYHRYHSPPEHYAPEYFPPPRPRHSYAPPPGYHGAELVQHQPPPQHHYFPYPPMQQMPPPMPQPIFIGANGAAPASPPAQSPPPPAEDPAIRRLELDLKRLQDEKAKQDEDRKRAEWQERIRLEEERKALQKMIDDQKAADKRKEEVSDAEKKAKAAALAEFEKKAAKTKEEEDKKVAEAKKKFDELEKKKKEQEEELKNLKGDPDSKKAAIRIKDGVLDRKFDFPWSFGKSWSGTRTLLEQAYESWPELAERVRNGRMELLGPDRQIILPPTWENVVQPGMEVTVLMANEGYHVMGGEIVDPGRRRSKHHKSSSGKDKKHKSSSRSKRDKDVMFAPAEYPFAANATAPVGGGSGAPLFGAVGPTGPHLSPLPPPIDGMKTMDLGGEGKRRSSKRSSGLFGLGGKSRR